MEISVMMKLVDEAGFNVFPRLDLKMGWWMKIVIENI